jgi:hypothetical protein
MKGDYTKKWKWMHNFSKLECFTAILNVFYIKTVFPACLKHLKMSKLYTFFNKLEKWKETIGKNEN